jgi:hypothetical protein
VDWEHYASKSELENVLDQVDAPPNFNRFDFTVRTKPASRRNTSQLKYWQHDNGEALSSVPLFGVHLYRYNLRLATLVHKKSIRNYEMGPRSSDRMTPALVIKGTPL